MRYPLNAQVDPTHFVQRDDLDETDMAWRILLEDGHQFTVLDRMTGYGYRDVETGYRDADNVFWLAYGFFDIRNFTGTYAEAIDHLKANAQIRGHRV